MPDRIGKLRARIAERGLAATLGKALRDHGFRHSESVILESDPRAMRAGSNAALPPDITFAVVEGTMPLPPLCPFLSRRMGDFRAMCADGKLGLFVLRGGVAVSCVWMALRDHHDRSAREHYRVAPGEAYIYSFLLDPAERDRGTALLVVRETVRVLLERGIHRQFSVVDRANRASYMVVRHFKGRECGRRVRHFYILGTRWTWMSRYTGTLGPSVPARRHRRG